MESRHAERRHGRRVELAAPVRIRRDAVSVEPGTEHVTGNVSVAGVYFETEDGEAYRVDDLVTASVSIPEAQRRSFPFTRLAGRGRVVRIDTLSPQEGTPRYGVALEFGRDVTVLTAIPPQG